MKKLFAICLTILMVCMLFGCKTEEKEDTEYPETIHVDYYLQSEAQSLKLQSFDSIFVGVITGEKEEGKLIQPENEAPFGNMGLYTLYVVEVKDVLFGSDIQNGDKIYLFLNGREGKVLFSMQEDAGGMYKKREQLLLSTKNAPQAESKRIEPYYDYKCKILHSTHSVRTVADDGTLGWREGNIYGGEEAKGTNVLFANCNTVQEARDSLPGMFEKSKEVNGVEYPDAESVYLTPPDNVPWASVGK